VRNQDRWFRSKRAAASAAFRKSHPTATPERMAIRDGGENQREGQRERGLLSKGKRGGTRDTDEKTTQKGWQRGRGVKSRPAQPRAGPSLQKEATACTPAQASGIAQPSRRRRCADARRWSSTMRVSNVRLKTRASHCRATRRFATRFRLEQFIAEQRDGSRSVSTKTAEVSN